MTASVVVRNAEPRDYQQWLLLWAGYCEFYERRGPTAVPQEVTDLTWQRFFDAYEPMHCLVAEQGDRLVGFTHYIFHRNTTMVGPTCYLQDLFAANDIRGTGAGRALIEGVYDCARAVGSTRVYWMTHETNAIAQRLYDRIAAKSGFIQYRKDV